MGGLVGTESLRGKQKRERESERESERERERDTERKRVEDGRTIVHAAAARSQSTLYSPL